MGAHKGRKLDYQRCPLCNAFKSKRITSLAKHFEEEHKKSAQEVWNDLNGGAIKCKCGCGLNTKWNGWGKGYSEMIAGHNGKIYVVCTPEDAAKIAAKRSAALIGKEGWSKGLTKENDSRVAERAQKTSKGRRKAINEGKIKIWNSGLTRHSDERVAESAKNLKEKFAKGDLVPWSKGLTKETDGRIERMSHKVSLSLQRKELRERLDSMKRLDVDEVKSRIESSGDFEVIDGLQNYTNRSSKVIVVKCKTCNEVISGSVNSLWRGKCFHCSPGGSRAQEDIAKWIESVGVKITRNDRKTITGNELDIFCPQQRVAVEYNGLYWHSHINKSSAYHNNKSKIAHKLGINLLHIFEDEWRDRQDVVKSIILDALGLNKVSTVVRFEELSKESAHNFFVKNHIDSAAHNSIVSFGAINELNEVVAAVNFKKITHLSKSDYVEISRFCASTMAILSMQDKKMLLTRACQWAKSNNFNHVQYTPDARLNYLDSNLFLELGFIQKKITPIVWWWTDMTNRFNRFKYKADSEQGLTEAQVAESAGVVKIWGCENSVFVLNL